MFGTARFQAVNMERWRLKSHADGLSSGTHLFPTSPTQTYRVAENMISRRALIWISDVAGTEDQQSGQPGEPDAREGLSGPAAKRYAGRP